jgi:hypothetical protein
MCSFIIIVVGAGLIFLTEGIGDWIGGAIRSLWL